LASFGFDQQVLSSTYSITRYYIQIELHALIWH
jgi:hypothetical protein